MAKRRKLTPRARTVRRGLHYREVSAYAEVARVPTGAQGGAKTSLSGPFTACVAIGAKDKLSACAAGRNPRKAIAAALRKAAARASRRGGSFAGL